MRSWFYSFTFVEIAQNRWLTLNIASNIMQLISSFDRFFDVIVSILVEYHCVLKLINTASNWETLIELLRFNVILNSESSC